MKRIKDPLIELLAIKLYEHDHQGKWPVPPTTGASSWLALAEQDREAYRQIARGDVELPEP